MDTNLLKAVENNDLEGVKEIIPKYNIRCSDELNIAAQSGYLDIVIYLSEYVSYIEKWAIIWAAEENRLEVIKYLYKCPKLESGWKERILVWSAKNATLEMVQFLVSIGINPKINNLKALRAAAKNNNIPVVKYLANLL
jgi:ankyrin repeat protein